MKHLIATITVIAYLAVALGVAAMMGSSAPPNRTLLISASEDGVQSDGDSWYAAFSADGSAVAYDSDATMLVADDTNGERDVFLYDFTSGTTTLVSRANSGALGNGLSEFPILTADGGMVIYHSSASNLVEGDTNGAVDVFAYEEGSTTRLSVSTEGREGNGDSRRPVASANGRFIAYYSFASTLVEGDTNNAADVFLYDDSNGTTTRISVSGNGSEGDADSTHPSISADGQLVAFQSSAGNLVEGDTNNVSDIFVHNFQTGVTARLSIAGDGKESNGDSREPMLAADGMALSFISDASNLVSGDTNGVSDIFVYDFATGEIVRVSVASDGAEGDDRSLHSTISGDGAVIAFYSFASTLVAEDNNATSDIFMHTRTTGETVRVSVAANGAETNGGSFDPWLSGDGRRLAYHSDASNLVAGDTNGRFDVFVYTHGHRTFLSAVAAGRD